jgi:hypothetical protein
MGRVSATFISHPLHREIWVVPDTAAAPAKGRGIMRLGQVCGDWEHSIEKLKEQWTRFTSETFLAIAEEEMRLQREELRK